MQGKASEWVVKTEKGDITCEHVICATGNYARQTAKMVGFDFLAIPVEHQYIVTDVDPVLLRYREAGNPELPILRESDAQYYLREERMGWILGPYEKGALARFSDGVDAGFEKDLCPDDFERLMPHVEATMVRVPSFEGAGIKDIVNGPISYTPDGNLMVGPAFGLKNFWLSEGHSFGVTAAGVAVGGMDRRGRASRVWICWGLIHDDLAWAASIMWCRKMRKLTLTCALIIFR